MPPARVDDVYRLNSLVQPCRDKSSQFQTVRCPRALFRKKKNTLPPPPPPPKKKTGADDSEELQDGLPWMILAGYA